MKRLLSAVLLLCLISVSYAQLEPLRYGASSEALPEWVQLMYADDPDPGAVQAAYDAYYTTHPFEKNSHTQYFKRWKRELGHDIVPKDPQQRAGYGQNVRDYLVATEDLASSRAANWSCIGPFDWDHGSAAKSYACGAAHVYTMEQSPLNANLMYAGTATCGVWKTTDKGLNWTNVTKGLVFPGVVQSIELDPAVQNTVYFGGGKDLWKTTDGGTNWNTIGDATFQGSEHDINDIVIHPANNLLLFVLSDQGLWRSVNGGTSFTQVQTGVWQELEIQPNDPDTVYAVKQVSNRTEFWRSANAGASFVQVGTGWPNPVGPNEQMRTEIAVSPASRSTVYALCTGAADGGSGLYGVYRSTDRGATWTFRCCGTGPGGVASLSNPNLMGYSGTGEEDGGQYYYDVAFAVDPANANKLHVGGIHRWVSTDGGTTFTCPAAWSQSNEPEYIHADIHDIRYFGTELWVGCDGGVFFSTDGGNTFNKRMFGIAGTDFWGFGAGGWTGSNVMLGGTYHNGTLLKDNNVYTNGWVSTDGGDGIRGFMHPQYDRKALSDYGYKTLSGDRLVNNASATWSKQPNADYIIGHSSEVEWHPNLVNTAFLGKDSTLWRTDDEGASFTAVHDFGEQVMRIEVAFNDPNTMYVCTWTDWWGTKHVYRTVNGGVDWTDITPTVAQLNGNEWVPYDIAVSATDPQTLWLVRTSMYGDYPDHDGFVTYKSVNGGTTWTNTSTASLNGEWPTGIAHHYGINGGLYIGTRRAVYYRSDATGTWSLWNAGLPGRIFSTRLLINYRDGKIRNATDRSIWESALEAVAPPIANFSADRRTTNCIAPSVQFWDNSALRNIGATWSWSFPGGSPSTSSSRSPLVTYSIPGAYSVSLTVMDANGSNTRTIPGFITFQNSLLSTPVSENAESQAITPPGWQLQNPDALMSWNNTEAAVGPTGTATRAWWLDNYSYDAVGQEDRLVSPPINLGGSAGTRLSFHHAYAQYSADYIDGLRVDVSANCGANWTQVYFQSGAGLATAPMLANFWMPTSANHWLFHDIDLSAYDGQSVLIRFVAVNGFGNSVLLDNIAVTNSGMRVAVKLMLEGAYDGATLKMRDELRGAGILPALEPYTALGFTQVAGGGGEVLQPGVLTVTGDNAIVDWVQVELRNAATPSTIVATRPALVQRDGDVVAEDGVSPVSLLASAGNYRIAVRHRNHLGAMSSTGLALSATPTAVDFTQPGLGTYGTSARKQIGDKSVLWLGNVVRDGGVKYTGSGNDRDPILVRVGSTTPNNSVNGYFVEDCTLNGQVRYTGSGNDRDPILVNVGSTTPNNVRVEQLP